MAHYVAERGWGLDVIMCTQDQDPAAISRLGNLPGGVRTFHLPFNELPIQRAEQWLNETSKRVMKKTRGQNEESSQEGPVSPQPQIGNSASAHGRPGWEFSLRGVARAYWATVEYEKYRPWGNNALALARQIVKPETHFGVVSSGPPHMMHDIGRRISSDMRLPFVMDMRDPWSLNEQTVEHLRSPVWYYLADFYEKSAVERATLIVANTEVARRALVTKYPARRKDIVTVMNGIDEDTLPTPGPRTDNKFVIAHAGTLYLDRDPTPLFNASAQVINTLGLSPSEFGISLIGSFAEEDYPLQSVVRELKISEYVEIGPPRPHLEALKFMSDANMLVVMAGANQSAIPAKVFEYMRFNAWILALCAENSATAQLLGNAEADVVGAQDVPGIAQRITDRYKEHQRGVVPPRLSDSHPEWSRRAQANYLMDQIEERMDLTGHDK